MAAARIEVALWLTVHRSSTPATSVCRWLPVSRMNTRRCRLRSRPVTARDLKRHRRVFMRDTGSQRQTEVAGVELRWTVSHKATSIRAAAMGLAYTWMPEETIREEL